MEQEQDVEITVQMCRNLLGRNQELSNHNQRLEQQLDGALERNTKLQQEIHALRLTGSAELVGPPLKETGSAREALDSLQQEVDCLLANNTELRTERLRLEQQIDQFEEQEHALVTSCIQQLTEQNSACRPSQSWHLDAAMDYLSPKHLTCPLGEDNLSWSSIDNSSDGSLLALDPRSSSWICGTHDDEDDATCSTSGHTEGSVQLSNSSGFHFG